MARGTVLVVEDELHWRQDHEAYLMRLGFIVRLAANAADAIRILNDDNGKSIRYVLVDYCLSAQESDGDDGDSGSDSGKDFIEQARRFSFGHLLKFVLVSAVPLTESGGDARKYIARKDEIEEETDVEMIDKELFKDRDRAYRRIAELFSEDPAPKVIHGTPVRRLLVGLGVHLAVLKAGKHPVAPVVEERLKSKEATGYVPLADLNHRVAVGDMLQWLLMGCSPQEEDFEGWQVTCGPIPTNEVGVIQERAIAVQLGHQTLTGTTWEVVPASAWVEAKERLHGVLDPLAFETEEAIFRGDRPARVFFPHWYRAKQGSQRVQLGQAADSDRANQIERPRDGSHNGFSQGSGELNAVEGAAKAALTHTRNLLTELEQTAIKGHQGMGPLQLVIAKGGNATDGYAADFDIRLVLYEIDKTRKSGPAKPKKAGSKAGGDPRKSR